MFLCECRCRIPQLEGQSIGMPTSILRRALQGSFTQDAFDPVSERNVGRFHSISFIQELMVARFLLGKTQVKRNSTKGGENLKHRVM